MNEPTELICSAVLNKRTKFETIINSFPVVFYSGLHSVTSRNVNPQWCLCGNLWEPLNLA
jgi:hypothetical protein